MAARKPTNNLKQWLLGQMNSVHASSWCWATIGIVVAGFLTLLFPWFAAQMIASVSDSQEAAVGSVFTLVLLWAVVLLVQGLLTYWTGVTLAVCAETAVHELREQTFDKYLHGSWLLWSSDSQGDKLARLTQDTQVIGHFFGSSLPMMLPQAIAALGAFGVLMFKQPVMSIMFFLLMLPILGLTYLIASSARRSAPGALAAHGELIDTAHEQLSAMPVLKAYSAQTYSAGLVGEASGAVRDANLAYYRIQHRLAPVTKTAGTLLLLGLLSFIVTAESSPQLTLSALTELLLYGLLVVRPASGLANFYGRLQMVTAAFERLSAVERTEAPHDSDAQTALELSQPSQFNLKGTNLSFSYPGQNPLLQDASLELVRGRITLLRGTNGIGKSTVAALLLRLIEPQSGQLYLAGRRSAEYPIEHWRRHFGYVPQDACLFRGTVRDNICLGRDCTEDQLSEAAEIAQITELIESLPGGFDFELKRTGSGLSGGQKQRIALARAILTKPEVLILDEPSSMLDAASRDQLAINLSTLKTDAAVFIVSHDSALIEVADQILGFEEGRLICT